MHAEDYLHWEAKASLENYFELKHMAEERKAMFVKLKMRALHLIHGNVLRSS